MIPAQPTPDEASRIEALRRYAVLDTLPEEALDDLTALAAQICGTPIALISLVDENRQWFKSRVGLGITETARDISFCGHAVHQQDLFIVPDATLDERFVDNPLVTGSPKIRFYAGAPLVNPEDAALGALCVIDHVPRVLTQEQEQALRVMGRQVMTHLELRRHMRELVETEGKFLHLAENITDVLWITSPDLNQMHYVSPAYEQIWGRTAKDLYAHPHEWFDTILLEDRKHVFEAFATLMKDAPKVDVEYRVARPDGTIRWIHDRGFQVRNERGVLVRLSGIASDITERKKSELASLRLGAIVEFSDDAIIGKDLDSIITSWNNGAERIFGYTADEMIGNSIMRLIPTDRRDEERQILEKISRGESVEHFETLRQTKDGRLINISVTASPIKDALGTPIGVSKVARDITERKRAEEARRLTEARYSTLFEYAPYGILMANPESYYIDANAQMCQMLGYTREELIGLHASNIVAESEIPQIEPALSELNARSDHHREWLFRRKDGSTFQAEVIATMMPDGNLLGMVRDITERKKAEADLIESERKFRAIFDGANDAILMMHNGVFIDCNSRALELFGVTRDQLIGQSPARFSPPTQPNGRDSQQAIMEMLPRVLAGERQLFEWLHLRPDGTPVHAEVSLNRLELGGETYIQSIVRDITERKEAEDALKKSEGRFRLLVEHAADSFFLHDVDGNFLDVNRCACESLGYSREELLKMNVSEVTSLSSEEAKRIWDQLQPGSPLTITDHHRRKDGTRFPVEVRVRSFEVDGQKFMLGLVRDITERKQAEERIAEQAALLDKAQDAIVALDLERKVIFWNRGAEHLYGWTREEVLGRNVSELFYKTPEQFEEINRSTISQGEWSGELVHLTKDRREVVVQSRRTLIRDHEGRPKSFLVINSDITEKKKIEAQFMRAQRMESIGTLAGGVAHDLNNILAPIMMSIDVLKAISDKPQAKAILETIEVSAKRGADIVRQVLSFARGLEGERIEVQPKHLLKDLENIIKDTFPKDIQLQFSIPNDTWTILGDPTQVHQILLNLCVNARDAMPNGGNLTIGVENCELDEQYAAMNIQAKPGRYVNISVTDSGTGMPPALLEKIFEPFFTTKEVGKGTGLGLSTVMAIVKSHDGFTNVYSESGKGTTFKVYLPAMATSVEARKEQADVASLPRGNGETVLVVDDEASILSITSQTLQAFGYRVLTAANGADAVAMYAQHRDEIGVVLTDMMMPVMDGPATIHALMRIEPAIKIIAASGLNANGGVAKASSAGIKHFLNKPYTAGTLLKAVREILDEA